jgi:hypothetical protein
MLYKYIMKNITIHDIKYNIKCYYCGIFDAFTHTPNGGDYIQCPLCENTEYKYKEYDHNDPSTFHDYDHDDNRNFSYCDSCNIIYDMCCTHMISGCTDNTYNARIIYKYVHNDIQYIGSPMFDSVNEWKNESNKIKILEWKCLRNTDICHPYKRIWPYDPNKNNDLKVHCELDFCNDHKSLYNDI